MPQPPTIHPYRNALLRHTLLVVGWIAVVLGLLGIVLPLLPTTPFLILAAGCFLRSSPRFYHWLVEHRILGPYLRCYLAGEGIPRRAKWVIITMLWLTISLSALLVGVGWIAAMLWLIAVLVTLYIAKQPEPDTSAERG